MHREAVYMCCATKEVIVPSACQVYEQLEVRRVVTGVVQPLVRQVETTFGLSAKEVFWRSASL